MSIILRRTGHTHASMGSASVLVIALLAGLAPAAIPPAAHAAAPRDTSAGGLSPTIQYQEAMAHANDRLTFTPGGRVTIPFRPRADDAWRVDGRAPRALPAGRLSGKAIRDGATPPTPPRPAATPDVTAPAEPAPSASQEPDASPAPSLDLEPTEPPTEPVDPAASPGAADRRARRPPRP